MRFGNHLFAPTSTAADNLADESVHGEVVISGNTVVDACREHAAIADERSDVLNYIPSERTRLVDPLDYLDFLRLESTARVIVTDSGAPGGGVDPRSAVSHRPAEHGAPRDDGGGVNGLCEPEKVGERLRRVYEDDATHDAMTGHPGLYGDGGAGERIVETLADRLS